MSQASLKVSRYLLAATPSAHFIAATIAAFGGRTIHTYHTEGAGRTL
jgi:urease alpha subunit